MVLEEEVDYVKSLLTINARTIADGTTGQKNNGRDHR